MRYLALLAATALITGCGAVSDSASSGKAATPVQAFEGPVPRAVCGPGSQPEKGEQGRISIKEKESGISKLGYWCNLEHVGKSGDGALWQMAWYEDCAYYGLGVFFAQGNTAGFVPGQPAAVPAGGVAVVDASDPANPVQTMTLTTPAMMDPWETLKVNDRRGLLAGSSISIEGSAFDIYDVKSGLVDGVTDCAHPRLLASSFNIMGHEGEWAPDGMTYYSSGFLVPTTTAIDVSIPSAPRIVGTISDGVHGLSLNDAGTRIYAAEFTRAGLGIGEAEREAPSEADPGMNGLEIWDVSAIQGRAAGPTTTAIPTPLVGAVYWTDGSGAQMTIPVTIKGRPYVIFIDEGGDGMTRIIDIGDERNPVVVSKLKNEINMPDAQAQREEDGHTGGFQYQGHYCGVPQREDPGVVACSYFWQGVRVWDIRNPHNPKEIAYYIPPLDENDDGNAHASSAIRFVKERGELWFTNQNTGFHIVRFTNGVWPFPEAPNEPAPADDEEECSSILGCR
jgi:hypothetical protein